VYAEKRGILNEGEKKMSERIYEEVAVIIKMNYTVRILGYKERGSEFTEINIFNKELTSKNDELSDNFTFGFTVKGRWEKEKNGIERMNEREFEEFIKHMTHFLEKKYNIVHKKEEKKEEDAVNDKKEEDKKEEDINLDDFDTKN